MVLLILILSGLVLGSFVNALVWRLHVKKDWVKSRSECPNCHHILAPKDLIPVFSWILLKGKCRYCRRPIDDSPLVELVLSALFVLSYVFWPEPIVGKAMFDFALWLIFLTGFLILSVYDLKWFLLPDKVVFPLVGLASVQIIVGLVYFDSGWSEFVGSLVGAGIISGLFYVIFVASKGAWIGFGDVKLGIVLGVLAGGAVPALMVLFTASTLGALISLPLVLVGKASRKTQLPFGPLLIAGLIIVVLFGQSVIDWYVNLLV